MMDDDEENDDEDEVMGGTSSSSSYGEKTKRDKGVFSVLKFGWNSVFSAESSSGEDAQVGLSAADVDRLIDRTRGLTDGTYLPTYLPTYLSIYLSTLLLIHHLW